MLIPIPIATNYRVTIDSTVERHRQCEKCGDSYSHIYPIKAIGYSVSPLNLNPSQAKAGAQEAAEGDIERAVIRDEPPFPCPSCGWYQTDMVQKFKASRLSNLKSFSKILYIPTGIISGLLLLAGVAGEMDIQSALISSVVLLSIPSGLLLLIEFIRSQSDLNPKPSHAETA